MSALRLVHNPVIAYEEAAFIDVPLWRRWNKGRCRFRLVGRCLHCLEFRKVLKGLPELSGQIAVAFDTEACAPVERVFTGPFSKDHLGMIQEVAVDGNLCAIDLQRRDAKPFIINMIGWHPRCPLAKKHDVGHHGGSLPLESIGWKANGSNEVGFGSEVLADGGVLFVEGEVSGHEGHDATGLQCVDGFGEKVIVQGQFLPLVFELYVSKRNVADNSVDAVLGQAGIAEVFDADVLAGVNCFRNPPRDGIHFNADEACIRRAISHEIAGAASRFQNGCFLGHAQAADSLVDRLDDSG